MLFKYLVLFVSHIVFLMVEEIHFIMYTADGKNSSNSR